MVCNKYDVIISFMTIIKKLANPKKSFDGLIAIFLGEKQTA
jgi:hypothetical protein